MRGIPALLLLLLSLAPLSRAAEPGVAVPPLSELLEGYRAVAPARSGVAASGKVLTLGHLRIGLEQGALYPLETQRGERLGVYFEGRGFYVYSSEDPADQLVLDANVTRNGSGLKAEGNHVRDGFDRFLMFFARPVFEGELEGAPTALDDDTRAGFDKLWKRIGLTYLEYDHLAAEARLNEGDRQYAYAEFDGRTATVGYVYDTVRGFHERLWSFEKYQGVDIRFVRALSTQSLPWPAEGPASLHLHHAKVDVATDDNRSGTIASELTLELAQDGLRVVPLGLINNRSPNSWDWAATKYQLRVREVTDADGRPLSFSHRYHEILVQLPEPSRRGERKTIRFATEGEIFTDVENQHGDNYFELFTVAWFPKPFRWDTSAFTFDLTARTRKPFYPVATGTSIVREEGEHYRLESRSTKPVSQPALFAGKYKSRETKLGDVTIRVHFYAMASKFMLDTLPGLSSELVRFYQDHLGPLPYEELDVVEIPTFLFGIAPSGVALLPTQAFNPGQDWISGYLARGAPSIVAHEIAHQWFGHRASPAAPEENWLAESFAEYLSGLAMQAGQTDERRVAGFKRMFGEWQAEAARCDHVGSLATASILGGEEGGRDRYCLLYNRGPLVLHMFRSMVGEQNFYAVLRRWLEQANYGPTRTTDLAKVAGEVLRTDMSWFFEQWHNEAGIPTVQVTRRVEADGAGIALVGRVEQPAETFKRMMIPFVLEYADGRREAKVLLQERPVQEFRYVLPQKPTAVSVDPARNNLATYR